MFQFYIVRRCFQDRIILLINLLMGTTRVATFESKKINIKIVYDPKMKIVGHKSDANSLS